MSSRGKSILAISIILFWIITDQVLKFWVKTNMTLGEDIPIFDWFHIYFVENKGMAFGMEFGGEWGKIALTLFRTFAVVVIGVILRNLVKTPKASVGLVISMSLIFAGAIGNIIDSAFYGQLFSASTRMQLAEFLPGGGGYAPWLQGKVVDMLFFPLFEWKGTLPNWVPFIGGEYQEMLFFRPIFNLADTAISLGVFFILIFQRSFFQYFGEEGTTSDVTETTTLSSTSTSSADEHTQVLAKEQNELNQAPPLTDNVNPIDGTQTVIMPKADIEAQLKKRSEEIERNIAQNKEDGEEENDGKTSIF